MTGAASPLNSVHYLQEHVHQTLNVWLVWVILIASRPIFAKIPMPLRIRRSTVGAISVKNKFMAHFSEVPCFSAVVTICFLLLETVLNVNVP